MENFGLSMVNSNKQAEKERVVPLGYESIPPQNWLLTNRDLDYRDFYLWRDFALELVPNMKRLKEESKEVKNESRYHNSPKDFDDYFIQPFDKMKNALANILLRTDFAEHVAKGEYSYLLGEDSSGRIPTLLLKEVIDTLAESSDQQKPEVRFYAGLRDPDTFDEVKKDDARFLELKGKWEEGIEDFIKKIKFGLPPSAQDRILLCTDVIGSGVSMRNIANILEKYQIDFDIVTFGSTKRGLDSLLGHRVFNGRLWQDDLNESLRGNYLMSGVWKEQGDVHAHSIRVDSPEQSKDECRENVREDLAKLIAPQDSMKLSRDLAKFVGANVAQAFLDYKAGKFELPKKD